LTEQKRNQQRLVTPPFTGGLFLGSTALNVLNAGPFVIDHDQLLGAHGVLQYSVRRNLWIGGAVRYDSGLVSNPPIRWPSRPIRTMPICFPM
jgi:hypothetical protein